MSKILGVQWCFNLSKHCIHPLMINFRKNQGNKVKAVILINLIKFNDQGIKWPFFLIINCHQCICDCDTKCSNLSKTYVFKDIVYCGNIMLTVK